MSYILGINAYHADAAAALVIDGKLIAAVEEERFRRIKHWAGFPSKAIRYCLDTAGVKLEEVTHVAVNNDPKANLLRKLRFVITHNPDLNLVRERIRNSKERISVEVDLARAFPGEVFSGEVRRVEHHLAHMASAFFVSPFDEALVVSIDGFGDFASSAWGVGQGNTLSVDERIYFPHSLGIFYQAITQYLGFPQYGDEYKVMGLAPYGSMKFMDEMREIVNLQKDGSFRLNMKYFRHGKEKINYEWKNCMPVVGTLYTETLEVLLGPARQPNQTLEQHHKDIARSTQGMYEGAFFHLLNNLKGKYQLDAVALAGGCAMNSVANGKIFQKTSIKKIYIQSAAGDAGGAIGAAMVVWQGTKGAKRKFYMDHGYWGPDFGDAEIETSLEERKIDLEQSGCSWEKIEKEDFLCEITAKAIAEGTVVGWFQGRMEWGPRALGNRSILGDPRRKDMKDILNLKIKRRESFRPFAPSILRDSVSEWFEEENDVPFMMQVFQVHEHQRSKIPAVVHVDGSGRLQTVCESTNQRYFRLIEKFYHLTNVPIVLNTSFNENEPIVCKPQEALDCFLRTKMDVLVLGNYFIKRESSQEEIV